MELYDVNLASLMLGSLMKRPQLLSLPEYPLDKATFAPSNFHQVIFVCIAKLARSGVGEVTEVEIESVLQNHVPQMEVCRDNNYLDFIYTVKELANPDNYEYYYSVIRKFALLRELDEQGVDIKEFYDTLGNESDERAKLEKLTIEQILNAVEYKANSLRTKYDSKYVREEMTVGEDIEGLLAEFDEKPSYGAFLYSPYQTELAHGFNRGHLFMRSMPSGVGKALPNSTIIPTLNGDKRVDEIQVGDYLFSRKGKPTKVLGVFPQGKKEVYELTFKDGRKAKCCNEHLWNVYNRDLDKGKRMSTVSVAQILERGIFSGKGFRYSIPLNLPVEYSEKDFYIPPYIMGLALGDASFRSQPSNHVFSFSAPEAELVEVIAKTMNWSYKKNSVHNYSWTFYNNGKLVHVEDFLKEYPELINTYSHNKFIPEKYLTGSIQQRKELLQGLLDTDGSIEATKGRINYSTTSEQLKENIITLCRSLGLVTTSCLNRRKNKNDCWNIHIQASKEQKPELFRYSPKKQRALDYANIKKREERRDRLVIIDIQPLGYEEEMTCFMVDNEEHLFLTNDFIVTHNTRMAIADICGLCVDQMWNDEAQDFIPNPNYQGAGFFIHTELAQRTEMQPMFLACVANVPSNTITMGKCTEEERKRVIKAAEIIKNCDLRLIDMPDFTSTNIDRKIKECVEGYGAVYGCFDYMMLNSALSMEYRANTGVQAREDMALRGLATDLKAYAEKYNIGLLTMTQTNGNEKQLDFPDESCISSSKASRTKVDFGCVILPAKDRNKEMKLVEPFIKHQKEKGLNNTLVPNRITYIYKSRFGEYQDRKLKIFHYFDMGTMRNTDFFVCDSYNKFVSIPKPKLK